ncbi:crotonyl-CoA carboxylase/reductase [Saccharomonospora sp. NPDC046836]|uniref:crotonyl-CoA carboxylase/reductase n=1 Tax=Saccharomonospora sp. NPDC046836 TaxID=3156921 RepID=UPI0034075CED
MDELSEVLRTDGAPELMRAAAVPPDYVAAHLRREDEDLFRGVADKDVRKALHVGRVPMPELAPDEVLIGVMASSLNYNTVWSATFEPVSTFGALRRLARGGGYEARHDQPFHVVGSDAAGVVVRTGAGVRRWRVGDRVVVNAAYVDDQDPLTHMDGMLGVDQKAWGYETNFGGLAHYAVARASQLLPKPAHLTWEEAACVPLCGGTAYRMLVSDRGARIKQGDVVLIWGAAGGVGSFAVQLVRNGGGIPIGVVNSESKAEALKRLGCDIVLNRAEIGLTADEVSAETTVRLGKRLGKAIRAEVGEDPHVVFDHVGRQTFGISVLVARRGGTVVTCGSTTGYEHTFDNRYLWMGLKRIVGSHGMNLHEADEMMRLCRLGAIAPTLSTVYPLSEVAEAARSMQTGGHVGKVGVLCLAPEPGLGVTDQQRRASLGEAWLGPLRR